VLLLHGLGDNRTGMTGLRGPAVEPWIQRSDAGRARHGTSGGNLATFGLLETDDISRWLDWVQQNDHPMCIFGLGESMGAAELLQSLRTETRFAPP